MTTYNQKGFFSQKKVFLMILLLIIIFFISYLVQFSLSGSDNALNLKNITYGFTSHEKIVPSEIRMNAADDINEIRKKPGDKYVYIKADLPDVPQSDLVLRSFNGTAKISVAGEELFNNMDEGRPSGASYITVPLDWEMTDKTISILLYSPLSDVFDIRIQSRTEKAYMYSNVPFAFFYILAIIGVLLVGCLLLCLKANKKNMRISTYLTLFAFLMAIAVFIFEYLPTFSSLHFLFNLKLFIYLLIPIIILLELVLRLGAWDAKTEAILSINILYASCILCLGENIFFFTLLYSGVFFQATNLLFAIHIITKHGKSVKDFYCVSNIVFWLVDLVLWLSIAFQKVHWQPISFVTVITVYSLGNAYWFYSENREKKPKGERRAFLLSKRSGAGEMLVEENSDEVEKEASEDADKILAFDYGRLIAGNIPKMSDDSMSALIEFYNMITNKVYGKDKHSFNVSEYSRIISYSMGMSEESVNKIAKAAVLHDIGKICIPEHILFKIGKLTEEEFQEIKRHNIYGYQLLSSNENEFFKMAALVAKEHHEHIDGSGYLGLKGSDISIPARIVAVADVFDALVSKRSYKEAWSFEGAVTYIAEHSDSYFDKDVVNSFISAKDRIYDLYLLNGGKESEIGANERR